MISDETDTCQSEVVQSPSNWGETGAGGRDMGTVAVDDKDPAGPQGPGRPEGGAGGTCGVLGQIDDDRIQMMGLLVRTHRLLTDSLGRELEETVGIPLVYFDVLIHVAGAPEGRLT